MRAVACFPLRYHTFICSVNQAGVAKYIQEHFDTEDLIAVGSSAGSLTATLLKTGGCFDTALSYAVNMVDRYFVS